VFSTEFFNKIYFLCDAMKIENYPRKIEEHPAILKPTFRSENKSIRFMMKLNLKMNFVNLIVKTKRYLVRGNC